MPSGAGTVSQSSHAPSWPFPFPLTPFRFLAHAHDRLWERREIPLAERSAACDLLWGLAIEALRRPA